MSGIPPTGIMGKVGATIGLGTSRYADSVDFYDIIFKALGGPKKQSDTTATWWGSLLLIAKQAPPTKNAAVYLSAPARQELAAVVSALKADPRFGNRTFVTKSSPPLPGKPRKFWVQFPDLDANTVFVTFTAPHP